MNIFIVDKDPYKAAIHLNDKHIVKMIVESAQLLSTTRRYFGDTNPFLYKSCFVNHPCSEWIRESFENYLWLLTHFKALCDEYTYRYLKIHKCLGLLSYFSNELPTLESKGLTKFALAMPDEYKVDDPVQSYRNYYLGKKIEGKFWTSRTKDDLDSWLTSSLEDFQFKKYVDRNLRSFSK